MGPSNRTLLILAVFLAGAAVFALSTMRLLGQNETMALLGIWVLGELSFISEAGGRPEAS